MTIEEAINQLKTDRDDIYLSIVFIREDNQFNSKRLEAIKLAIKALEKEIPKKNIPDDTYMVCPACESKFHPSLFTEFFEYYNQDELNHFPCCGQKIDWD